LSAKLLDTNVLVEIVRGNLEATTNRYVQALADRTELSVSTVSIFEFRYGLERSARHAMQARQFERLLANLTVAPFSATDADRTARLKADLAARGQMIGAYDLMIAGQALARGWTVVTGNTHEFSRVEGLILEDWAA